MIQSYCNSLTQYNRFKTREVYIGEIPLGGDNPIRLQSMTTTNTMDTASTVKQILRIADAGADYIRVTAPSIKDAEQLGVIKQKLFNHKCRIPLIADIHYTPNAAEAAARIVEKIRINPGNYLINKNIKTPSTSDAAYKNELDKTAHRIKPLIKICKEYGTAIRIGVNHGSLSERIFNRYGDTPEGMVESALEFVRFCEHESFKNIVISMKSSNPLVMVYANRLLINKMSAEMMNYPIHLGVTEAGEGEDGRIRSAMGIGALLEDGIGDTVRVSLTEAPENEIPVAKKLIHRYQNRSKHTPIKPIKKLMKDSFSYHKITTNEVSNIGGSNVPVVVSDMSNYNITSPGNLQDTGYIHNPNRNKWKGTHFIPEYIYLGTNDIVFDLPTPLKAILDYESWMASKDRQSKFPLLNCKQYLEKKRKSKDIHFVSLTLEDVTFKILSTIKQDPLAVIVLSTNNLHGMAEQRRAAYQFMEAKIKNPVIIKRSYSGMDLEDVILQSATDIGPLLIDGFGDGIWIETSNPVGDINQICFGLLQAARTRISKAEYVSCPSCGRTLFDLEKTTKSIKTKTGHLQNIKIGIMGCIVNGPGEMADADYGYVGSGNEKITLYRKREIVKKNLSPQKALDELIQLICKDGKWVDPEKH